MRLAAGDMPNTYYMYGPTPDNDSPNWYEFLYDGQTGAEINGSNITLHFMYGMRGDADLDDSNGVIVASPGGPAIGSDTDNDGVPDLLEDGGPNAGDGNDDGIADSIQPHVVSLLQEILDVYVVLEADPAYSFREARDQTFLLATNPSNKLKGQNFTHGLFGFRLTGLPVGGAASVRVILPDDIQPTSYYQLGSTPDNPEQHWYSFLLKDDTGATFDANVVTLQFVDGGRGDNDLDANGVIEDPGGPAVKAKISGSGGGGGGAGCSLTHGPSRYEQAGVWWLLLFFLSVCSVCRIIRR